MTVRVLDLFSGIGGFSLGLERAGMKTVAFCEIDPFCRKVLAKHWPKVPCYDDVRTLTAARLAADGIIETVADANEPRLIEQRREAAICYREPSPSQSGICRDEWQRIDLICGGFPCQDISVAGKGAGIDGARSGLWTEFARIIGEVRPQYVIVENVAALLGRGLARVLGDLAALGFDAEWHCIPASAVGAPHRRDRVWIIADAIGNELRGKSGRRGRARWADQTELGDDGAQGYVADADDANGEAMPFGGAHRWDCARGSDGWLVEPDVGRVAHGVPARVDRLRSLGNAVVPQIPELIGLAILDAPLFAEVAAE
jgi:DNA (cytosine-5)-methyltransferase 1